MNLDQNEIYRYARQFPVIGLDGQKMLKAAHIVCVGAGGLGCAALQYLVAAGIGQITIIDGDKVEHSNLQRQILYAETDIGHNKALLAQEKLSQINSRVEIHAVDAYLGENNIDLLLNADVVIDGTDNFPTRYLVNRQCRQHNIPLVSASIFRFEAQISTFNLEGGPCYECLYPTVPPSDKVPNCALGGVIGVIPGVVGSLQAAEAIKIITEIGDTLSGRLLCINLRTMEFKSYELKKNDDCGRSKPESITPTEEPTPKAETIFPQELHALQQKNKDVFLLDVREDFEREICNIKGSRGIPLLQLKEKLEEIPKAETIVVYCKAGMRGDKAAKLLSAAGYNNVFNLKGGILAWINDVDPSQLLY